MLPSLIGTLIGVAAGGIITWFVSRAYYQRATKHLNDSVEKLDKRIFKVLRALEEAGLIELARDKNGKYTGGLKLSASVKITIGG